MNDPLPPPLPPGSSQPNPGGQHRVTISDPGADTYNIIADKVGGVPNFRKKDNLYQAAAVAVFVLAGAGVGWLMEGELRGAGLGALGGLIAGILISGAVLMIVGLRRK